MAHQEAPLDLNRSGIMLCWKSYKKLFESEKKKGNQNVFLFLVTVDSEAVGRFLQSLINLDRKEKKSNHITKLWSLLYSRERMKCERWQFLNREYK